MSNFIHRYVLWPGLFLLLLFYLFFVTISWKRQCKSIADVFTLESISEHLWSLFKFFGKLAPLICHILLLLLLFDFSFLRFSSVQFSHSLLSHSATPWITALQASLYITNSQSHVHRLGHAIQPFHPLSSLSPPAPNPSQHQSLFQWVNSLHEVAKVLKFQLQHQSFQWTPRMDRLDILANQGTLKSLLQHHSFKASIFWRSAFFTVQL